MDEIQRWGKMEGERERERGRKKKGRMYDCTDEEML